MWFFNRFIKILYLLGRNTCIYSSPRHQLLAWRFPFAMNRPKQTSRGLCNILIYLRCFFFEGTRPDNFEEMSFQIVSVCERIPTELVEAIQENMIRQLRIWVLQGSDVFEHLLWLKMECKSGAGKMKRSILWKNKLIDGAVALVSLLFLGNLLLGISKGHQKRAPVVDMGFISNADHWD